MEALIDVVGHFGTTFSYATVASRVALALRAAGRLASVSNLDPDWHHAHQSLRGGAAGMHPKGTHVVLFTAPNHYVDVYAELYGRERSAIFVSPNTDRMAKEHAETISKFGLALAPSEWCRAALLASAPDAPDCWVLPLGVDASYAKGRVQRQQRVRKDAAQGRPCHFLHLSTDQAWPGRKGTTELLEAWALLHQSTVPRSPPMRLSVHLPWALRPLAERLVRSLDISDTVRLLETGRRGSEEDDLLALFDSVDVLVAPSRCEGFGMMLLGALVAGLPLLCTYNTGHADFLHDRAGWCAVPTSVTAPLYGEEGLAPAIDTLPLALSLAAAAQPELRALMAAPPAYWDLPEVSGWGTWDTALPAWTARLEEWLEETHG